MESTVTTRLTPAMRAASQMLATSLGTAGHAFGSDAVGVELGDIDDGLDALTGVNQQRQTGEVATHQVLAVVHWSDRFGVEHAAQSVSSRQQFADKVAKIHVATDDEDRASSGH